MLVSQELAGLSQCPPSRPPSGNILSSRVLSCPLLSCLVLSFLSCGLLSLSCVSSPHNITACTQGENTERHFHSPLPLTNYPQASFNMLPLDGGFVHANFLAQQVQLTLLEKYDQMYYPIVLPICLLVLSPARPL